VSLTHPERAPGAAPAGLVVAGAAPAGLVVAGAAPAGLVLAGAIEALNTALESLAAVDSARLRPAELDEAIIQLNRVRHRVEARTAALTHTFADARGWQRHGARCLITWLTGRTGVTRRTAIRLASRARHVADFPRLHAAWQAGEVTTDHVDAVSWITRRYPTLRASLSEADPHITTIALHCRPAHAFQQLRALCHRHHPDEVEQAEHRLLATAHLHASATLDGYVRVDGLLDPELGTRLLIALDAARRLPEPDAGQAAAAADASPGERHRLPLSQRNLAALNRILAAAASATAEARLPTVHGQRPTLHVTIPLATLTSPVGPHESGWIERYAAPATMITAADARRLACDGTLRPQIISPNGHLIGLLPTVRTIHPALRRAIVNRDHHCQFPDCQERIDDIHHIHFHSHGGLTTPSNLIGLCWHHHRLIHTSSWRLTGTASDPTFHPP